MYKEKESDAEYYARPENKLYLLIDDEGDIFAEINLPNHFTAERVENTMNSMARATSTKWTEF